VQPFGDGVDVSRECQVFIEDNPELPDVFVDGDLVTTDHKPRGDERPPAGEDHRLALTVGQLQAPACHKVIDRRVCGFDTVFQELAGHCHSHHREIVRKAY